ncbi:MAG: hypothetical protein K2X86_07355 [Cytophagaceae bacterium]|nr:hypothetical protein [Cytophagaceae bacterium]
MNTNVIFFAIVFLLLSCVKKKEGEEKSTVFSNLVSLTENEDKGVKEILKYYGGKCNYSVGYFASTTKENSKFFELELNLNQDDIIKIYKNHPDMIASNSAYIFYKNLQKEKTTYDEIRVVVIFKNEKKQTFGFPVRNLEIVRLKMNTYAKVVNLIKDGSFDTIKTMLNDNSIIRYDKNRLIDDMIKAEDRFGKVKGFNTWGFKFSKSDSIELLHLSGVILRDKENNQFSMDFDINADDNEVLLIQYKL